MEARKATTNEIIATVQQRSDTTFIYLTDDMPPDFLNGNILGRTYVSGVIIWFQGNYLNETYISVNKNDTLVDIIPNKGHIIQKHPIQWTLKFIGEKLMICQSNISNIGQNFGCE